MYLDAGSIRSEIREGRLIVVPFRPERLKPASYVLSLGNRFRRWSASVKPIKMWSADATEGRLDDPIEFPSLILQPGEFVLATTVETIGLATDRIGFLSPLSHVARFGLGVNGEADLVNPGYGRDAPTQLTLELFNRSGSPLQVDAGMPIAHLRFGEVRTVPSAKPRVRSIYEGADPLTSPRFFEEWSGHA